MHKVCMAWTGFQKGREYTIKYINNAGQKTERKIRVVSAFTSSSGKGYIRAWCRLRKEERTFRTDRVVSVYPSTAVTDSAFVFRADPPPAEGIKAYTHTCSRETGKDIYPLAHEKPCAPTSESSGKSGSFGKFLLEAAALAITFIVLSMAGLGPGADIFNPPASGQAYSAGYLPVPQPGPAPGLQPVPGSVPAPQPGTVPLPQPAPPSSSVRYVEPGLPEAKRGAAGRAAAFRNASGITDPQLEKIYEDADINRDGRLDWNEIQKFQNMILRRFVYKHNETALRPDDFLDRGGGDCEDWALFTCGLLQYWGIKSYVGGFYPETGPGHAVVLVYTGSQPPRKFSAFDIKNFPGIPDGWYVPIDYGHIGALSNAVGKGWKLKRIFIPREIYGIFM